jgi:hypothetical protein
VSKMSAKGFRARHFGIDDTLSIALQPFRSSRIPRVPLRPGAVSSWCPILAGAELCDIVRKKCSFPLRPPNHSGILPS